MSWRSYVEWEHLKLNWNEGVFVLRLTYRRFYGTPDDCLISSNLFIRYVVLLEGCEVIYSEKIGVKDHRFAFFWYISRCVPAWFMVEYQTQVAGSIPTRSSCKQPWEIYYILRPTQPTFLSGMGNEYQPMGDDVVQVWLVFGDRSGKTVWYLVNHVLYWALFRCVYN